eukprot:TRINITY_DN10368_c0_g1_i1.p1 TRINITY_DN10368_c0_g1~~TRINITY_DN10368_c0_g1_i1.p1  ORF type:complete len:152 (-),score=27.53 TRINITY_DN10368_c0_g1_i1:44-499(-)
MSQKKIILGADHGGAEMKQVLADYLKSKSYEVEEVGSKSSTDKTDYPNVAESVCNRVVSGEFPMAILTCGSGIGISIAANKVNGIRCALCHDHYTAKMSRQHNNANVLAIGGRNTGVEVAKEMVDAWLNENFAGSYHQDRLNLISNIEKKN